MPPLGPRTQPQLLKVFLGFTRKLWSILRPAPLAKPPLRSCGPWDSTLPWQSRRCSPSRRCDSVERECKHSTVKSEDKPTRQTTTRVVDRTVVEFNRCSINKSSMDCATACRSCGPWDSTVATVGCTYVPVLRSFRFSTTRSNCRCDRPLPVVRASKGLCKGLMSSARHGLADRSKLSRCRMDGRAGRDNHFGGT